MDADAKKTALRMIPYGIYVLTAEGSKGVAAATVNWVTQTSFDPPLVVVRVKADSGAYHTLKDAGHYALNMLGKGQQSQAFTFFKPAQHDGDTISGEPYRAGTTGAGSGEQDAVARAGFFAGRASPAGALGALADALARALDCAAAGSLMKRLSVASWTLSEVNWGSMPSNLHDASTWPTMKTGW